jgi:uncharacterized protein
MSEIILKILSHDLSVCKLTANGIPDWAAHSGFLNYAATGEEVSLVCESQYVPHEVKAEKNWKCITIDGILDFSLVGIIATITGILAQQNISVFVISTFDTDYILLRSDVLSQAVEALKTAGYHFIS